MKRLLAVVIFEVTPLVAMIPAEYYDPCYRRINSFLEAYMSQKIEQEGEMVTIYDYEDSSAGYSLTIEHANEIIFETSQEIVRYAGMRRVPEGFDILVKDPASPLKEKIVYHLQMGCFARFNLNEPDPDEDEWKVIASNRMLYRNAWATHDSEKIKKVLHIPLHTRTVPFKPLIKTLQQVKARVSQTIEKEKALKEKVYKKLVNDSRHGKGEGLLIALMQLTLKDGLR